MIIVEQHQKMMINYNNVIEIAISDNNLKVIYAETIENQAILGKYETEERTREVFMELSQACIDSSIYIMPAK